MAHPKRSSGTATGRIRRKRGSKLVSDDSVTVTSKVTSKAAALRKARLQAALKARGATISIDVTGDNKDRFPVRSLRFGAVTVSNTAPDAQTLVINVNAGREALGRAREAFTTAGVKLQLRDNIPTFRVDSSNPKVLIREIGGRIERGRIVEGAFIPVD